MHLPWAKRHSSQESTCLAMLQLLKDETWLFTCISLQETLAQHIHLAPPTCTSALSLLLSTMPFCVPSTPSELTDSLTLHPTCDFFRAQFFPCTILTTPLPTIGHPWPAPVTVHASCQVGPGAWCISIHSAQHWQVHYKHVVAEIRLPHEQEI